MTSYGKRGHMGYFINIEFLVCLYSPFYVEYNGESFKRKDQLQAELLSFVGIWVHSYSFQIIAIKDLDIAL